MMWKASKSTRAAEKYAMAPAMQAGHISMAISVICSGRPPCWVMADKLAQGLRPAILGHRQQITVFGIDHVGRVTAAGPPTPSRTPNDPLAAHSLKFLPNAPAASGP